MIELARVVYSTYRVALPSCEINTDTGWSVSSSTVQFTYLNYTVASLEKIINKATQITFKFMAIIFFLSAIASVLATLFAISGSSRSPGLFLAVVLAGIGKWQLGKSQGKSAQETFGRAIEIAEPRDELETLDDRDKKIPKPQRDVAGRIHDQG